MIANNTLHLPKRTVLGNRAPKKCTLEFTKIETCFPFRKSWIIIMDDRSQMGKINKRLSQDSKHVTRCWHPARQTTIDHHLKQCSYKQLENFFGDCYGFTVPTDSKYIVTVFGSIELRNIETFIISINPDHLAGNNLSIFSKNRLRAHYCLITVTLVIKIYLKINYLAIINDTKIKRQLFALWEHAMFVPRYVVGGDEGQKPQKMAWNIFRFFKR